MSLRDMIRRWALGAAVGVIATVMYHGTQSLGAHRAVLRASCTSWDWIAFRPEWFWPYVSVFVLLGFPWFALRTWRSVRHFAIAFVLAASPGWLTFVLYPTACVRPASATVSPYLAALYQLDGPNNCFPCLHALLAVFGAYASGCDASRLAGRAWRVLLGAWAAAILVSILALRQHTGIDVLAGLGLAAFAVLCFNHLERLSHDGVSKTDALRDRHRER